jgi:hypothetical protein
LLTFFFSILSFIILFHLIFISNLVLDVLIVVFFNPFLDYFFDFISHHFI